MLCALLLSVKEEVMVESLGELCVVLRSIDLNGNDDGCGGEESSLMDKSGEASALDYSMNGKLSSLTNSQAPPVKPNQTDPMRLWYTVDTDPRTAKKIALDALTFTSIDQSVYIMLQVDCKFNKKFDLINIQDLVFANLRNGMSLMELSDCLRMLAKYAKELLKPSRERYKHWNKIPFMKSGVAQKWTKMEGTAPILHQLGYTHETSKGFVFPLTAYGPPIALIKVLALELAMSAAELSVFYNNRHPKPEVITEMLYNPRQLATSTPSTAPPVPLPPMTTQQGNSYGSFNVMDLLSSNMKTIKDSAEQKAREEGRNDSYTPLSSFNSSFSDFSSPEQSTQHDLPRDFSVKYDLHKDEAQKFGEQKYLREKYETAKFEQHKPFEVGGFEGRDFRGQEAVQTAHTPTLVSPGALPNLSIFGDMFALAGNPYEQNRN